MKLRTRLKNAYLGFTGKGVYMDNGFAQLMEFLGIDTKNEKELSEATYFACMKILAESLGKMPLKLLRNTEGNGVVAARDHPLYYVLKERPNRYMNSSTFWSTMEYNRNHYGNSYALIRGSGADMKLYPLDEKKIQVYYDDARLLGNIPDIYYKYASGESFYTFGSEEILHFKTSNTFDGIKGISVREQLKNTIQGNLKAQSMQNKLYENGMTAKAVLQYTGNLNDANVKALVAGIERYASGDFAEEGIKNIIPLPLGFQMTPLNTKLADNQFIELKKYSALQIASAFGIKPNQIGDYTKSSYASAEAQQLSFYVDTLLYIIKQYEEELNYKLLTEEERKQGYHFKFNVSVILRADFKTQLETLGNAVSNGLYTPNEARSLLDLENKEGADELLCNGASIPVKYAGIQYMDNSEGGETNE